MLGVLRVASEGIPLNAEKLFSIGPIDFTNSILMGLVTAIILTTVFYAAAKRSTLRPNSRFAYYTETVVEFILNIAEENLGSRKKAIKHLPLLLTLFTFILLNNLTGIIPGINLIEYETSEGSAHLLRAFTADLNGTLALAILSIGLVQFYAITELGILQHLKHYFTDKPYNPMNLFIGLIEVMGEFIRIITLSMRLFGVIYAGKVLMYVIADLSGNFSWAASVPVALMELFFACIQAYLFVMLVTVYLSIATAHGDEHHESDTASQQVSLTKAA